jgi:hypothetical protein
MSSLTVRASGPAAAPNVWEAYADPQRWPEWAPHLQRVDAVGRLRPGLKGQVSFDHGVDVKGTGSGAWLTMHGPLPILVLYAPFARVSLHRLVRVRID